MTNMIIYAWLEDETIDDGDGDNDDRAQNVHTFKTLTGDSLFRRVYVS